MKSGLVLKNKHGFTIVEVLIVLAVSAAFLISALSLISGSQNKTLFNQAINDAQQQIDQLANNVANGYYPQTEKVGGCKKSNSGSFLDFSGAEVERGTNGKCTFLGRVIQFTSGETATVFSVAGLRRTNTVEAGDVTSMVDAMPTVLEETQTIKWKSGIRVSKIVVDPPLPAAPGAIGFFTGFGSSGTDGSLKSGALSMDFLAIRGSELLSPGAINNLGEKVKATSDSFRSEYNTDKNPAGGITLCFNSGTTKQHGIITIGGAGKTATSTLIIKPGDC